MIGISKLYCGTVEPSDALRYGRRSKDLPSHLLQFSEDKKPVVVWNLTRSCNLNCMHCYARAVRQSSETELDTEQSMRVLDDLAAFGAPVWSAMLGCLQVLNFNIAPLVLKILCYQPPMAMLRSSLTA